MSKDLSPGRKLLFSFAAGQVKRWHIVSHTIRPQDVAQHTFGVVVIITMLHPDPSARLLKAAVHHDLGELKTGDMPYWTKASSPELRQMLHRMEDQILLKHGLQTTEELNEEDIQWIKGADRLDAFMFILQNVVAHNHFMQGTLNKIVRELRDGYKNGRLPTPLINAMEQVLSAYAWIKVW